MIVPLQVLTEPYLVQQLAPLAFGLKIAVEFKDGNEVKRTGMFAPTQRELDWGAVDRRAAEVLIGTTYNSQAELHRAMRLFLISEIDADEPNAERLN
jgi:hypothetical protein